MTDPFRPLTVDEVHPSLAMLDHAGDVSDEQREAFLGAGYSAPAALEVALIIGIYTISTFANRLTRA